MKYILCLLALLVGSASASADETLNYCLIGRHDKTIDKDFQKSFARGWVLFQSLSERDDPQPTLKYSLDVKSIRIFVYPDTPSVLTAGVVMDNPTTMRIYYKSRFGYYSPERKAEVIAHELCHMYYGLLDEYNYQDYMSVAKHNCAMGNFIIWGWFGTFCSDCQAKVDAYYKRKR
jgi:hypothetical protein